MPSGPDTIPVTAYIPKEWGSRVDAWAKHRGQSRSAAAGDSIRDSVLRYEDGDTKEKMLEQMRGQLAELIAVVKAQSEEIAIMKRQQGLILSQKWSQLAPADGHVYVEIRLDEQDTQQLGKSIAAHLQ